MKDRFGQIFADEHQPTDKSRSLLAEIGFLDVAAVWRRLRGLRNRCGDPRAAETCLERLLIGLWKSPAPDAALISFERYLAQVADADATFAHWDANPRAIEILIKIFGGSQYLTETLLQNPEWLEPLTEQRRLSEVFSREDFTAAALEAAQREPDSTGRWDAIRRFQRREILRIGACDAFGLMDLRTVTNQLSLLADGLVRACLAAGPAAPRGDLRGFCVIALGKLGGEELNYSSDIDLLFLAEEQPERWAPLAQGLIRALQSPTAEGFLYRVDMRLRPWGRAGALVSTAAGFLTYLRRNADLWERQALLKARVIAGDASLGERVLAECQPIVFSAAPQQVRDSVRATKARIEAALVRAGRSWGEVKSGLGSLRDIEFVTQTLQLIHGGRCPQVRSANTLDGLIRLADFGLLHADEYRQLTGGYLLLRTIEHALQLMHNRAEHALPTDRRELTHLARRLDYPGPDEFVAHYERHIAAVRTIFARHVQSEGPLVDELTAPAAEAADSTENMPRFSAAEQRRHWEQLQQITPERPASVSAELLDGPLWRVTVLGIDHPGELSMICGLLFVYGCDIVDGLVTTGDHPEVWSRFQAKGRGSRGSEAAPRRDFVDVFTVQPPCESTEPAVWIRYEADLLELMHLARTGRDGEAQGRLAKRVAAALEDESGKELRLSPIDVELDNEALPHATVMHIRGEDTIGFVYELTNALALIGVQIERMAIRSAGQRVSDILQVTHPQDGAKLSLRRQQELRAAVVLIKHFTHLLPRAPNPEAALLHFRSFVTDLFRQPNWTEELSSLERPDVLEALAQLLGFSDFLWEDFLRLQSASLFPLLRDVSTLQRRKDRAVLAAELQTELAGAVAVGWDESASPTSSALGVRAATFADAIEDSVANADSQLPIAGDYADAVQRLNAFKDREMFRVDMRHILGHIREFTQFADELTDIADVVVEAALNRVLRDLKQRHGTPRDAAGRPVALSAAALGKFGGGEMGFASDIELLFVYEAEGATDGDRPLTNATFFQRVVERFRQMIHAPREGVFHIDLRLRPYGRAGQLAVSLGALEHYFAPHGPAWPYERQALVKLRPVAGDRRFAAQLVAARDRLLYTDAEWDVAAVRAMRERQVRQLVRAGTFNAKLSPGGVVDIEYLVQMLQLQHGCEHSALRTPNTLAAAAELERLGLLAPNDHRRLRDAYLFFRRMIDALRMVRGNARDLTVPSPGSEEFDFLARRLGFAGVAGTLHALLAEHIRHVNELVRRYL